MLQLLSPAACKVFRPLVCTHTHTCLQCSWVRTPPKDEPLHFMRFSSRPAHGGYSLNVSCRTPPSSPYPSPTDNSNLQPPSSSSSLLHIVTLPLLPFDSYSLKLRSLLQRLHLNTHNQTHIHPPSPPPLHHPTLRYTGVADRTCGSANCQRVVRVCPPGNRWQSFGFGIPAHDALLPSTTSTWSVLIVCMCVCVWERRAGWAMGGDGRSRGVLFNERCHLPNVCDSVAFNYA